MEKIFEIIYNLSFNKKILSINDIDIILELLIDRKDLDDYILDIELQQIRSNKLASYSHPDKRIYMYSDIIDELLEDLKKYVYIENDLTKYLYYNLRILQVILHEVEHANQHKIYKDNTLESFILRISQLVPEEKQIYEYAPMERFAEIKSFNDINEIICEYRNDKELNFLINQALLKRKLRGYHYINNNITSPTISYFIKGDKEYLLNSFDWFKKEDDTLNDVTNKYDLNERLFYGFPISKTEYFNGMTSILNNLNKEQIRILRK